MLRRKGAYSRFKGFLESGDMLKSWYRFENDREQQALRSWCEENQIPLSDQLQQKRSPLLTTDKKDESRDQA